MVYSLHILWTLTNMMKSIMQEKLTFYYYPIRFLCGFFLLLAAQAWEISRKKLLLWLCLQNREFHLRPLNMESKDWSFFYWKYVIRCRQMFIPRGRKYHKPFPCIIVANLILIRRYLLGRKHKVMQRLCLHCAIYNLILLLYRVWDLYSGERKCGNIVWF